MAPGDVGSRPQSSLPLQIVVYFNHWWSVLYFVLNLVFFTYKGWKYPYVESAIAWEVTFVFLFAALDVVRLFLCALRD